MVRIEKLLWEQLVNVKALNRERQISSPSKWYNQNRHEWMGVASHNFFNVGITGKITDLFMPLLAKLTYRYRLDIAHQRGLTLEDTMLFSDRELRRCYFFETLARQNLHPYMVIFFRKRRARYYKVERGVRGFYVPDWVRKEAEDREYSESSNNIATWNNFVYDNYMSDMTPIGRWSHLQKLNPLDLFSQYGWFRTEAWDRYFYNEIYYDGYTEAQKQSAQNPFGQFNLQTSEGRASFEKAVNRFAELFPYTITKPGEKFDFKNFYVKEAIQNNRDVSGYDQSLVQHLKEELASFDDYPSDNGQNKTQKLKAKLPEWVLPKAGQSLQ